MMIFVQYPMQIVGCFLRFFSSFFQIVHHHHHTPTHQPASGTCPANEDNVEWMVGWLTSFGPSIFNLPFLSFGCVCAFWPGLARFLYLNLWIVVVDATRFSTAAVAMTTFVAATPTHPQTDTHTFTTAILILVVRLLFETKTEDGVTSSGGVCARVRSFSTNRFCLKLICLQKEDFESRWRKMMRKRIKFFCSHKSGATCSKCSKTEKRCEYFLYLYDDDDEKSVYIQACTLYLNLKTFLKNSTIHSDNK